MAKSATSPSGTGSFSPVTLPPSSLVSWFFAVGTLAPSASAKVPISLPAASWGRYFFFCSSLPAARIASVAR